MTHTHHRNVILAIDVHLLKNIGFDGAGELVKLDGEVSSTGSDKWDFCCVEVDEGNRVGNKVGDGTQ